MIRCLAADQPKQWDMALAQVEFAFNSAKNRSIGCSPFVVVYTKLPDQTVDLLRLPHFRSKTAAELADQVVRTHQEVKARLIHSNSKYKEAANKHQREKLFSREIW